MADNSPTHLWKLTYNAYVNGKLTLKPGTRRVSFKERNIRTYNSYSRHSKNWVKSFFTENMTKSK